MSMMLAMLPLYWGILTGFGDTGGEQALTPAEAKAVFRQVAVHLQPGGTSYVVKTAPDPRPVLAKLMKGMGGASPEMAQLVPFMESIGVFDMRSVGGSLVPAGDGLYDTRVCILRPASAASKPLWAGLLGQAPTTGELLRYLPAESALVLHATPDPKAIWRGIEDGIVAFECNGDRARLPEKLAQMSPGDDIGPKELLAVCGNEWAFTLQLGPDTMPLPMPGGQGVQVPVPGFLVVGKVNEGAAEMAVRILKREYARGNIVDTTLGGVNAHMVAEPARGPLPTQPVVGVTNGVLIVASTPKIFERAVASAGSGNGLVASPNLGSAFGESGPGAHNLMMYADAALPKAINQVVGAIQNSDGGMNMGSQMMLLSILGTMPEVSSGWTGRNTADAVLFEGRTKGLLASYVTGQGNVAQLGMVAGIAMPAMHRARTTARHAVCRNNLRMIDVAKEQWAMENNKVKGDAVSRQDLKPYVHDEEKAFACPQGGQYEIGPVGEKPRCTVHGPLH